MKLYRAMKVSADGLPEIGSSARTLGIRRGHLAPFCDVKQQSDGERIAPGEGGMSVAPDDPAFLPPPRRPLALGGYGIDLIWVIESDALSSDLNYRGDSPIHGLIEPSRPMSLLEFERSLHQTRNQWVLWIVGGSP